jgi:hypothetical protein
MAIDGAQVLSEVPDTKKISWPSSLKAGHGADTLTSKNSVVSKQWQKPRKGNGKGERRLELGFDVGTRHDQNRDRARTLKCVEGTSQMTNNYLLFIVLFVYLSTSCRYPYLNMVVVFFNLHYTCSQSKTDPFFIKCRSMKTYECLETYYYSFLTSTRDGSD